MLDCRDGTILKPESARKGHRERSFYELVYNKSLNADYFSESLRCCETLRQLRAFIPIYLGIVQLAEHPDGKCYCVQEFNVLARQNKAFT